MDKVMTCIWFDDKAEDAARFYVSLFGGNSRIKRFTYYDQETVKVAKKPVGSVLTVEFTLRGRDFMFMNGGPEFKLSAAVSLVIDCRDQKETDSFWNALLKGGEAMQCGWLTDRFGLCWQVVPREYIKLACSKDTKKVTAMNAAMMKMVKLDLEELKKAYKEG
jgi:predicted 3-demethylubiquinone-9 3-methyltransferase (glyoxalase superfamily)